jgi:ribosomal protein S18 acetylase RimI-like enzyme
MVLMYFSCTGQKYFLSVIVSAKKSEIPEILDLTRACARAMIAQNIFQWNEHYPSAQAFETDIDRNELYLLKTDKKIIGTLVCSTFMDEEYEAIEWLTPNQDNLYIHRLAVHPDYQKQGHARDLMKYAEAYAKLQHMTSVRLDTFSQNHRNQKFYEARGYHKLGNIYFPKQSTHPFYCYELVL